MRIGGQVCDSRALARIQAVIDEDPERSRRSLSLRVCEELDWRTARGVLKAAECRAELKRLADAGKLTLRPACRPAALAGRRTVCRPAGIVPVHCPLSEFGPVDVVLVKDRRGRNAGLWNSLMEEYHYLRRGHACGAQLRYLAVSERYGAIGGLCFSAASRRLSCRDEWIGWSDEQRRTHLDLVTCNSRFLIRPEIRVPHLASHLLGTCTRRLRSDWRQRYGYAPVLAETFVESERFAGTCYRAANWLELGKTAGRGRQDSTHSHAASIKTVFVLPLTVNWRDALPMGKAVEKAQKLEAAGWAGQELGTARLGDARLTRRAILLAEDFFDHPEDDIPEACGCAAAAKAAYRFFGNKAVTMSALLDAHRAQTEARMAAHRTILAVQDTTSLNYNGRPCMDGLGPISHGQPGSGGALGLELHDTVAFTEQGVPLGVVDAQCWARQRKTPKSRKNRNRLPISTKESYVWLQSYRTASAMQSRLPGTRVISVGDREADIYDLFADKATPEGGADILVRSARSRKRNSSEGYLWDWVPQRVPDGSIELHIPARSGQKPRTAKLLIRFTQIELVPPGRKKKLPTVTAWAVHVVEVEPPPGSGQALEWLLITTVPLRTFDEAVQCTRWYSKRWGIEVYHRTLKSGCRIEDRQFGDAEGIKRCLAIDMVVAWRVLFLVKQGRETPDLPCTVFFDEDEWKALLCRTQGLEAVPENPPSFGHMARLVALLGGFLGRKGDGDPGATVIWRGLQRLADITAMYRILVRGPPRTV